MEARYKIDADKEFIRIFDMKPNIDGIVGRCVRKYKSMKAALRFFKKANENEEKRRQKLAQDYIL